MVYDDDDDFTTDSNTVTTRMVVTNEGTCAKHPHVKLRGRDASGRLYQRDSCYDCDAEFQQQQKNLLQKQQELDRQIQNLDKNPTTSDFRNMDINGVGSNHQHNNSSNHVLPPADELSTATSNATGMSVNTGYPGSNAPSAYSPYGPYPPPPYAYPPAHYGYAGSVPGGKGGGPPPHQLHPHMHPGWGPPPPLPPPMQQPQQDDSKLFALLTQKEDELKELRNKYEDSQSKLQNQTVELSRLQSKLEISQSNVEQERKIAKLEAEAAANEKLEHLVQEQRMEHKETMKQMQEQMSQAAAAIALARNEAPPPPVLLNQSHPSMMMQRQTSNAKEQQPPETNHSPEKKQEEEQPQYDDAKSLHTEDNHKLPPVHKFEKGSELPMHFDSSTLGSSVLQDEEETVTTKDDFSNNDKSPVEYSLNDNDDANNNTFQKAAPPPSAAATAAATKPKPWQQNYQEDGNNSVIDELSMGGSAIDALAAVTKKSAPAPATTAPAITNNNKRSSHSNKINGGTFTPKFSDPNEQQPSHEQEDNQSLGQTVASSTYGEDRQKVVNKTLLDPYGDRGIYTGVVLRTTGMPHGLGRMVYEEDGRVFEGDWYVLYIYTCL